jgi:hypothetical protein
MKTKARRSRQGSQKARFSQPLVARNGLTVK